MANLNKYREVIQNLITEIYGYNQSDTDSGVVSQVVFDTNHNHYLLIDVGWEEKQFVHETIIHITIRGDKVWIQLNNTDIYLAERLVEEGIPKEKIVLGLHSPFMRQATGYAVS